MTELHEGSVGTAMHVDGEALQGGKSAEEVLQQLQELRQADAPTHGGKLFAFVYDSGRQELDDLAAEAANLTRHLNGLDPTTFPSIAAMERDLVSFMRQVLHGDSGRGAQKVVGSITSGGTESCLLAVKTARDWWRSGGGVSGLSGAAVQAAADRRQGRRPRIVSTTTVHAAFQKAAELFDLQWDPVPIGADGQVDPQLLIDRLDDDVALVVCSAPAYATGMVDPVASVAKAAARKGISCHVDACFGGLVLPWWPDLPAWDFRVSGVTSISADFHKFGYAPKGVSVLLTRDRRRHRKQFFATKRWPAYPVVNPTLLGSRSASPLAAAWAIVQRLGQPGFAQLSAEVVAAAAGLREVVAQVPGLRVWGDPVGPAVSLIADEQVPPQQRVDPHHLTDELASMGFALQSQPGLLQEDGSYLPPSTHLTVTPVTVAALPEFAAALPVAATVVRGRPRAKAGLLLAGLRALGYGNSQRIPSPDAAWRLLRLAGVGSGSGSLPGKMAPLLAVIEALPAPVAEALLTEVLARFSEPD